MGAPCLCILSAVPDTFSAPYCRHVSTRTEIVSAAAAKGRSAPCSVMLQRHAPSRHPASPTPCIKTRGRYYAVSNAVCLGTHWHYCTRARMKEAAGVFTTSIENHDAIALIPYKYFVLSHHRMLAHKHPRIRLCTLHR